MSTPIAPPTEQALVARYVSLCEAAHVKPNSGVVRILQPHAGDAEAPCGAQSSSRTPEDRDAGQTLPLTLSLDLSRNLIGAKGLGPISRLVGDLGPHLATLILTENFLSNDSICDFCDTVQAQTHLVELDLSDNPLSLSAGKRLLAFAQSTPTLLHLRLDGTLINAGLRKRIDDVLQRRRRKSLNEGSGDPTDSTASKFVVPTSSADCVVKGGPAHGASRRLRSSSLVLSRESGMQYLRALSGYLFARAGVPVDCTSSDSNFAVALMLRGAVDASAELLQGTVSLPHLALVCGLASHRSPTSTSADEPQSLVVSALELLQRSAFGSGDSMASSLPELTYTPAAGSSRSGSPPRCNSDLVGLPQVRKSTTLSSVPEDDGDARNGSTAAWPSSSLLTVHRTDVDNASFAGSDASMLSGSAEDRKVALAAHPRKSPALMTAKERREIHLARLFPPTPWGALEVLLQAATEAEIDLLKLGQEQIARVAAEGRVASNLNLK